MSSVLWKPSASWIERANLTRFIAMLRQRGVDVPEGDYEALHAWSVRQPGAFWSAVWDFGDVIGRRGPRELVSGRHMTDAAWFPDAELNFAENLLQPQRCAADRAFAEAPALIALTERGGEAVLTRRELLRQAIAMAATLRGLGVQPGDRVAAVIPNTEAAIVAMLGASAIGATWSCCSPDFGADAICDRFTQIEPVVLITAEQTSYNGKPIALLEQVAAWLPRVPTVRTVIVAGAVGDTVAGVPALPLERAVADAPAGFDFPRFAFNHPLYILYSSGTTGAPKCIMHGAGGTLLQHLKEHQLHSDVQAGDRLLYYTSTGWMMWNWLVSVLASRGTAVLYDGAPMYPTRDVLFDLAARHRVTHLGAGARYYATLQQRSAAPIEKHDLSALRVVLSTGSPLLPETFDYLYQRVKHDICVASISGGTDIVSCFVLGCPIKPVIRGEIQCRGLGMDVQVWSPDGRPVVGRPGELVCASPFPSMPIGFWNDPGKRKYLGSYFDTFDNVWRHGDWATLTAAGGMIIEGRSDATLNPGGIRIGTAEIYQQVESYPGVAECLATAFRQQGDEQIVLFVRLHPDHTLDDAMVRGIKTRLRQRCSPRHVPAWVIQAPDFPRTINGKLSEVAVRQAIHRQPIGNTAALANPEALAFFAAIPEFQPTGS